MTRGGMKKLKAQGSGPSPGAVTKRKKGATGAAADPAPDPAAGGGGEPLALEVIPAGEAELAARIKEAFREVQEGCRRTVERAQVLGRLLLDAKGGVGHGKFQAWVAANCPFSYEAANV